MALRKLRELTSVGLIVTFLFTALVLPIVSPYSVKKEASDFAIKASSDHSGGSAQLPLAEKENKEEESISKKEHNLNSDFVIAHTGIPFQFDLQSYFINNSTHGKVSKLIPLFLTKRHLLI